LKSPESIVRPEASCAGNSVMKFFRRSSIESISSSAASASIVRSSTYVASGRPAPRYASVGVVCVNTPVKVTE
jgi:hypothetical protein